jgi:hypothetical protein
MLFNCALPNKSGITITTENVSKYAPNLIDFYKNDLIKIVSEQIGLNLYTTDLSFPTSCAILIYDREGDWINWHYDYNYYNGRFFTVLIPITNDQTCTEFQFKDKQNQVKSVNLTNNKIEFLISATHSSYIKTVACSLSAEQIYYPNQLPACDLEYNFSDFTSQVEENKNSNSKRMLEDTQTKLIKSIMSSDSWIPKSSFLFTLLKKRFDTNYRKGISVSDNKLPKRDMPEVSEFSLFSANENIISPEDIKNQNLKTHSDKTDKIQSKRNLAEALGISSIVKKLDF